MVDPPIYEANAYVFSEHFSETCYVSSVLEGFGPSRRTLKPDAMPTVFAFNSPPKRRKLSEARQAKAQHKAVVNKLLGDSTGESAEAESIEPIITTRDIGVQCGKIT